MNRMNIKEERVSKGIESGMLYYYKPLQNFSQFIEKFSQKKTFSLDLHSLINLK